MTNQLDEATDEAGETPSVAKRVKSLIERNRNTLIGVGTAAGVVGVVLLKHAYDRHLAEDFESDEADEPAESAAPEEKSTSGRCNDGSTSNAIGKQGACSYHGGVAR